VLVWFCLKRGADLHMAQLMPLTVSCFSKIQIGFTFLVPAHLGSPGKRAVKRARVCVRPGGVMVTMLDLWLKKSWVQLVAVPLWSNNLGQTAQWGREMSTLLHYVPPTLPMGYGILYLFALLHGKPTEPHHRLPVNWCILCINVLTSQPNWEIKHSQEL